MSLTLVLTRHAKSSWSNDALDDFDRPLNGRGKASATALGDWMTAGGHVPGDVIVSGARRTVDTWAGIAQRLPEVAQMRSSPAIYHGSSETILAVLRNAKAPVTQLIGHNPGIAEFAWRIVAEPHPHPGFADFPTGATAIIAFDQPTWSEIDWETGTVRDFVVPRDLVG